MSSIAFKGTLYPDRTFTLGAVVFQKKRKAEWAYDVAHSVQEEWDDNAKIDYLTDAVSIGGKFVSKDESPLFINSPKLSRDSRGSYGKHGITSFGKKVVRNASLLLERKYTKERLGFVTCTIPTFPKEYHEAINAHWSEIVRRFYQKLKRQLEKVGRPFIYVGVTEIQEKRFAKFGVPCPHLHFVYLSRSNSRSDYWIYVCQIHRAWNHALYEGLKIAGFSLSMDGDAVFGSVSCQRVKKSVSAYLGKYMSKGNKVLEAMKEKGWDKFPKQWWTACKFCKKLFKDSLISLPSDVCKAMFYAYEHYLHEGWIENCCVVTVEIHGESKMMGLAGKVSPFFYKCMG